jgi:hypothetical protein
MASALATCAPFFGLSKEDEEKLMKQSASPSPSSQQPHNSRVRMMYWTMRNDELATKQAELPQAGGADEGGIVLGRSRQRSHERLRRSDDESGEEMTEELNNSNNNCTDPFSQYAPLTQRHTHAGPQVLVVPSLHPCGPTASLLDYIAGLRYYEERQLYHIFLLRKRDPTFRVLFVSSLDIPCEVIGYYFRLMRSTGKYVCFPPPSSVASLVSSSVIGQDFLFICSVIKFFYFFF